MAARAGSPPALPDATLATGFLPGLHALRGLAALWVVLFHLVVLLPLAGDDNVMLRLVRRGPLAVDFFFVMSGYIIARRYGGARGWTAGHYLDFLTRRLARVYPLHLFMLLCTLGLLALAASAKAPALAALNPPGEVLRHLLLVQAWGHYGRTLNFPAWAISVEWLLYLGFPLLALPFARTKRAWALGALLLLCVARLLWVADYDPQRRPSPDNWAPLIGGSIGFGCGLALERLLRDSPPRWLAPLGWCAGLALPVALLLSASDWPVFLLFLPLTVAATLRPLPGCPDRLARVAGDLSYPLYMVHAVVILGFSHALLERFPALRSGAGLLGLAAGLLALCLLLAWRAQRRIEQPARHWLLRRLDRPTTGA